MNSERGQLLIEVLVALALAIVVATAFVSLGAVAIKNSQASKNQANATQLAQEGIEKLIELRDASNGNDTWTTWFNAFASFPVNTQLCTSTNPLAYCAYDYKIDLSPCGSPTTCEPVSASGGTVTYQRKVRVVQMGQSANLLDIMVFVYWTDASGTHSSQLERLIGRDKFQ